MVNRKFTLLLAMLVLAIFAVGSVSAADNVTSDIVVPTEDIAVDDVSVEDVPNQVGDGEKLIDFTSNATTGVNNAKIQFTDNSTGDISSRLWEFGDGNISDEQNPLYEYTQFGSYNVKLTNFYSDGTNASLIKNNYINIFYTGSIIKNPDFDEPLGQLQRIEDGYYVLDYSVSDNWNTTGSGGNTKIISSDDVITSKSGNHHLMFGIVEKTSVRPEDHWQDVTTGTPSIFQNLNFDYINSISFYVMNNAPANRASKRPITFLVNIGNIYSQKYSITSSKTWELITIDTGDKAIFNGVQLFNITREYRTMDNFSGDYIGYMDLFTCTYTDLTHAEFTYNIENITDDEINIQFNNGAYGSITNFLWEFDDGTISTELNPVHSFNSGSHTVKLTASNVNHTDTYSFDFDLEFPSINGQLYKTMQEAINNANDGDVIDVPRDLSESISVDKNLTLNFNGNKLIGSDSSPVIQVTGGAQATIKNITLENSNVISTDDESSLTITESCIADTNITLNTGNIALGSNEFNGSFITVANANAIIANNNIANGGIKVNGGKSQIKNNVLSGNDVAIAQTEGETNITSNIITDNNIGVNVTNGTANINFNVIYNNNKVSLAYVGSVDASNNWFGVIMPSFSTTLSEEYVDVYALESENQPSWLVLTLDCNETTLYSNQDYTISVDLTINSNGDNTSTLGALPKFNLPVSTKLGESSDVNVENSIGKFILTTGTLTSDETIFTIIGEEYTLDVDVFKIEDKIKELEKQLAEVQANNTKLAEDLAEANGKVGNLTTQLSDAQANATKLADELKDANQKADNLTTQLGDAQANATKLADELKDANQKADNLTTQLGDAQKQIQTLSADLISTTVAANNLSIKALTNGNILVTLKANGTALANKTVNVIINGVVYNGTTGEDGIAKIAVKYASAGTYYATITFAGDDTYKSSIGTSKVVVSKKATKITAPKKTFKAKTKTKKVKITLKSGSTVLKSKKITLKVNGKTYAAKTNSKGVATIKVTKLTKKGTFKYTVKFAGDKAYKAITKKGKMTIK